MCANSKQRNDSWQLTDRRKNIISCFLLKSILLACFLTELEDDIVKICNQEHPFLDKKEGNLPYFHPNLLCTLLCSLIDPLILAAGKGNKLEGWHSFAQDQTHQPSLQ